MERSRTALRVLASVGVVAVVASIPAWSLAGSWGAGADDPEPVAESWLASDSPSPEPTTEPEVAEVTSDAAAPEASTGSSASGTSSGGGAFDGTSGWIEVSGAPFWIGPPGSRAEVVATVAAYRANAGLPAFVPIETLGGWSCSMVAHGSAVAATEQTGESLGQRLIRRSPGAVGYRPPAGWAVTATVVVDELIVNGVVYPNRATQLSVVQCSPPPPPPTTPPAPPVDPPPPAPSPSPPADPPPAPGPTETPAP